VREVVLGRRTSEGGEGEEGGQKERFRGGRKSAKPIILKK